MTKMTMIGSNNSGNLRSQTRTINLKERYEERFIVLFTLRDWTSSVAMVVDEDGRIVQHNAYYPYGEPWTEPEGQPYLYAGKERMRLLSKGDSDFGPRPYNPATLQWWAPDRLAAETPWLSPYSYCAANPNKYSDLSGNRISCPGEEFVYSWQSVNGKWDFYDLDGNAYSGTGLVNDVRDALNYIMAGSEGNKLVRNLASDEKTLNIFMDAKNNGSGATKDYVVWNQKGASVPTKPNSEPNAMIDLAHELAHIDFTWNIETEDLKNRHWEEVGFVQDRNGMRTIPISEIYTTFIENLIRAEHGLNLRTHYIKQTFGNPLGQIIQGRKSLYFDINKKTTFKRLSRLSNAYVFDK